MIHFHFRGKRGKEHKIDVRDRNLASIVKRCCELPGQELFQYVDSEGSNQVVDSSDINDYLISITGHHFTAKDFRTWGGTVLALHTLKELGAFPSETQAKKSVVQAIKVAAEHLGNTAAICRKCSIHPGILDFSRDGSFLSYL